MKVVVRRNQSTLSESEKRHFVDAVLALKGRKDPKDPNGLSKYDRYVQDHLDNMDPGHFGPAFLPWHREFLRRFERDLQDEIGDPLLGLPYWDWSVDGPSIFTSDPKDYFMGGDGTPPDGKVTNGPFAFGKWSLNVTVPSEEPTNYLKRQLGKAENFRSLPTKDDVTATLNELAFDVEPYNEYSSSGFRNKLEGFRWDMQQVPPKQLPSQMHGRVHRWVGGSMGPMSSPNDPVFWLHHCFIDKLWADWQAKHPSQPSYVPREGAAPGHNDREPMPPWDNEGLTGVRPVDVMSHRPFGSSPDDPGLGYRYDTENNLVEGEDLNVAQGIWSANRQYYLFFHVNGELKFGSCAGSPTPTMLHTTLWSSGPTTPGQSNVCRMLKGGNLVIYDLVGNVGWESGTGGAPGGVLEVLDDGHVRIHNKHITGRPGEYWRRPPPTVG